MIETLFIFFLIVFGAAIWICDMGNKIDQHKDYWAYLKFIRDTIDDWAKQTVSDAKKYFVIDPTRPLIVL